LEEGRLHKHKSSNRTSNVFFPYRDDSSPKEIAFVGFAESSTFLNIQIKSAPVDGRVQPDNRIRNHRPTNSASESRVNMRENATRPVEDGQNEIKIEEIANSEGKSAGSSKSKKGDNVRFVYLKDGELFDNPNSAQLKAVIKASVFLSVIIRPRSRNSAKESLLTLQRLRR